MQRADVLKEKALELGAHKVGAIGAEELVLDPVFRKICEENGCGAYGIHVSKLAESAGMKYLNGPNTVTYFGAIF